VDWVCCWFSCLLRDVFIGTPVIPCPQKLTFPKFHFDPSLILRRPRSIAFPLSLWTGSCKLLCAPWVNKLYILFILWSLFRQRWPLNLFLCIQPRSQGLFPGSGAGREKALGRTWFARGSGAGREKALGRTWFAQGSLNKEYRRSVSFLFSNTF